MDLQLRNAAVCVSGGTKRMGHATAVKFAEEGARVCVTARDPAGIEQIVADMKTAGSPDAWGISLDLFDPTAIEAAYQSIEERWGELNSLVNVTGIAESPATGDFTEISEASWQQAMDIGLMSAAAGLRHRSSVKPAGGGLPMFPPCLRG